MRQGEIVVQDGPGAERKGRVGAYHSCLVQLPTSDDARHVWYTRSCGRQRARRVYPSRWVIAGDAKWEVTTRLKCVHSVWNHQLKDVPRGLSQAGVFNIISSDLGAKCDECIAYVRCLLLYSICIDVYRRSPPLFARSAHDAWAHIIHPNCKVIPAGGFCQPL